MRLGELPRGMTRTVIQIMDGRAHVRFNCQACAWTTAFTTTPEGSTQITPEHQCTSAELVRERLRQANEQELWALRKPPLPEMLERYTPEVM